MKFSALVSTVLLSLGISSLTFAADDLTKHPLILSVSLNQVDQKTPAYIMAFQDSQKNLFINADDLHLWHIKLPPDLKPRMINGRTYYNFNALPQAEYTLDMTSLKVNLSLPARDFLNQTIIFKDEETLIPQTSPLGGLFNYDIFSQKVSGTNTQTSGLFDASIFGPDGSLGSDFMATRGNDQDRTVRLNTAWNMDLPARMRTIRVGDSFNAPGMWGNSVDFGGIQWATNFSTQPNFITFPLPSTTGDAIAPSLAQIYLNNSLVGNQSLASGPFNLQNLPVVTGAGNVRMVVTNILGKQEVIDIPYYADQQLLLPGLHNFSFETGFIRKDFGMKSNDYGQFLISGTNTFGITQNLTAQWHTELRTSTQTVGAGNNYLIGHYGVLSTAAAVSHYNFNYGELAQIGFNHTSNSGFSYGFKTQLTTPEFRAIGFGEGSTEPPAAQTQVFGSVPIFRSSSIGLSYVSSLNRGLPNQNVVSANYSFQPIRDVSMTLTGLTDLSGEHDKAVLLSTSIALQNIQPNTSANISASRENNTNELNTQIQHTPATDGGFGYVMGASIGDNHFQNVGLNYLDPYGSLSANVAHQQDSNAYQLEATGGAVFMDKQFHFTRYSSNSFALVEIPGQKNIPLFLENNRITKTNDNGYAFITNLNPYTKNEISIDPNNLPMNTSIGATRIDVAPYAKSGVIIKFPVKTITSATLTLKQKDGTPIPPGAVVQIKGQAEPTVVGNDGFVYLTDLEETNDLTARWGDDQCAVTFHYKSNGNTQENLGTKICQEKLS